MCTTLALGNGPRAQQGDGGGEYGCRGQPQDAQVPKSRLLASVAVGERWHERNRSVA